MHNGADDGGKSTIIYSCMPKSQADPAELTAWCVALVAEMLEAAPDDINRLGLDSAMSVQLAVALEERLGIALSPDVIADHPTIAKLVAYVSALQTRDRS
jgi:acyl carrier protein